MKNYETKKLKNWSLTDVEDYFNDLKNEDSTLRVMTSEEITDTQDLNLQLFIADWYFKKTKREDNLIEDILKTIKFKSKCNDFLINIYFPFGEDDFCMPLKFQAISRDGIIQIGMGPFHDAILKGFNKYLTNDENSNAMIVIKGFNKEKIITYQENDKIYNLYEKEMYHFSIENGILLGIDKVTSSKIQEYDLVTNKYLGTEVGVKYINTTDLVAEMEVDNLMNQIGMQLLN